MQGIIFDSDDYDDIIRAIAAIVAHQDTDTCNVNDNDDDVIVDKPQVWGSGSCPGKAPYLERYLVFYSHLLFNDFWGDAPVHYTS